MSKIRDFNVAKRYVAELRQKGQLNEAKLLAFARQRRYEETVAALAQLADSTVEVIRPLMQSLRHDGLLVPCRAAGLGWQTVSAVLESRYSTDSMGAAELAKAKNQFAKITAEDARRLLGFWQIRASSSSPRAN